MLACGLAAWPLAAQSLADQLQKAPPEVDQRLRERITAFYQAHVDRKFRQAEQYVAEDTKDFFYERRKSGIIKFELKDVVYSDNFTRAKATVVCHQNIMLPGFNGQVVGVPVPSHWKIENGDWFFYVDEQDINAMPFGGLKAAASAPGESAGDAMPNLSSGPDLQALQTMVSVERDRVQVTSGEAPPPVRVASAAPGRLSLKLEFPKVPGFSASLESPELPARGSTLLRFHLDPQEPLRTGVLVRLTVEQTGQVLYVVVSPANVQAQAK